MSCVYTETGRAKATITFLEQGIVGIYRGYLGPNLEWRVMSRVLCCTSQPVHGAIIKEKEAEYKNGYNIIHGQDCLEDLSSIVL